MPSDENAQRGPQEGALNGPGGSDLSQAFKILSLHLPRVLGAASLAPPSLLTSSGSNATAVKPFNPSAAVFEALLKAMTGQPGPMAGPFGPTSNPAPGPMPTDPGGTGRPMPTPERPPNPFMPTAPTSPTSPEMPTKPSGGLPTPRITPGREPLPWEYTPTSTPEPTAPSTAPWSDPFGDERRRGRGGFV